MAWSQHFQDDSHASAGKIKRLCMSVNSSQIDAKSIYENCRCILKHFAKSPKSSKLLNNALNILDINKIHLLNWGSTRIAGFLDAFVLVSKIVLCFLDTIVTYSIRPEQTSIAASLKGIGSYLCRPWKNCCLKMKKNVPFFLLGDVAPFF